MAFTNDQIKSWADQFGRTNDQWDYGKLIAGAAATGQHQNVFGDGINGAALDGFSQTEFNNTLSSDAWKPYANLTNGRLSATQDGKDWLHNTASTSGWGGTAANLSEYLNAQPPVEVTSLPGAGVFTGAPTVGPTVEEQNAADFGLQRTPEELRAWAENGGFGLNDLLGFSNSVLGNQNFRGDSAADTAMNMGYGVEYANSQVTDPSAQNIYNFLDTNQGYVGHEGNIWQGDNAAAGILGGQGARLNQLIQQDISAANGGDIAWDNVAPFIGQGGTANYTPEQMQQMYGLLGSQANSLDQVWDAGRGKEVGWGQDIIHNRLGAIPDHLDADEVRGFLDPTGEWASRGYNRDDLNTVYGEDVVQGHIDANLLADNMGDINTAAADGDGDDNTYDGGAAIDEFLGTGQDINVVSGEAGFEDISDLAESLTTDGGASSEDLDRLGITEELGQMAIDAFNGAGGFDGDGMGALAAFLSRTGLSYAQLRELHPDLLGTGGQFEEEFSALETAATDGTVYLDPSRPDVNPAESAEDKIAGIMEAGSPLLQRAQTKAMQLANSRGLLNSSMATEAGTAAVLDQAKQIADMDLRHEQAMEQQDLGHRIDVNQMDTAHGYEIDIIGQEHTNAIAQLQEQYTGQGNVQTLIADAAMARKELDQTMQTAGFSQDMRKIATNQMIANETAYLNELLAIDQTDWSGFEGFSNEGITDPTAIAARMRTNLDKWFTDMGAAITSGYTASRTFQWGTTNEAGS